MNVDIFTKKISSSPFVLRGIQSSSTKDAFDPATVKALLDPKTFYKNVEDHSHVYITVDPAAGGDRSKYAILSAVYLRDGTMVVSDILSLVVSRRSAHKSRGGDFEREDFPVFLRTTISPSS